ncbi:hypothetical protein C8Z91_07500 [Paenibacillus elgii]|uniref:Uncharacterized protein n=1 Tax=Paenibacillus elgii TaxID=189691 RepID=A0A2T6G6W8_9BACL|nr:glycosyltransferase family 39 protein [Paenibacillus elgii]PUA39900.1 hypothetical protein C8Z91_07500 [Paenibacillus elgii]
MKNIESFLEERKLLIRNAFLLTLFCLNIAWFIKLGFHSLMGDDIGAWRFYQGKGLLESVFSAGDGKFRPVLNLFQYWLFSVFDVNYQAFFIINILFNFVIVYFLYKIIFQITKLDIIAFLASAIYITSRFSYYNILQVYGFMEALCLFFLLIMIYYSIKLYKDFKWYYIHIICAFNFLIVFTHERYIVLVPALCLLVFFHPELWKKKIWLLPAIILPTLLNYAVKKWLFSSGFLIGTGGSTINFDIKLVATFVAAGLANMFGFNAGPTYLNGIDIFRVNSFVNISVGIVTIIVLYFFGIVFFKAYKTKNVFFFRISLIFIVLFFSLMLAASITIRQELRWLYAPFIVFIIFFSYVLSKISLNKMKTCLLIIICFFIFSNDYYYKKHIGNVFFVYSQQIADSAYKETIGRYGESLADYKVYIQKHRELNWPLGGSMFFQPYLGSNFKVNYYDNLNEILTNEIENEKFVVYSFDFNNRKLIDVTNQVKLNILLKNRTVFYDFLANLDHGNVNPKNGKLDTPNGEGGFPMTWDNIGKSLTLISPYKYEYANIQLSNESKSLLITAYLPLEESDGARLYVEVEDSGKIERVSQTDLKPGKDNFVNLQVDLSSYSGKKVNISFGVESPSGDQMADWIALSKLLLVN